MAKPERILEAPDYTDATVEARKAYADGHGYFWLPCPLCGAESGGHEWFDRNGQASMIPTEQGPGHAQGICPACTIGGRGSEIHARLLLAQASYDSYEDALRAVIKEGVRFYGFT